MQMWKWANRVSIYLSETSFWEPHQENKCLKKKVPDSDTQKNCLWKTSAQWVCQKSSHYSLLAKSTKQPASLRRCVDLVHTHCRRKASSSVPACLGDWGTGTHWSPAGNGTLVTSWHLDFGRRLSLELWYGFFWKSLQALFCFLPQSWMYQTFTVWETYLPSSFTRDAYHEP